MSSRGDPSFRSFRYRRLKDRGLGTARPQKAFRGNGEMFSRASICQSADV
jgi:hypothetical protein